MGIAYDMLLAQTDPTTTTTIGRVIDVKGVGAGWLLGVAAVFVVLAWFVLFWVDARRANKRQEEWWQSFVKDIASKAGPLSAVELRSVISAAHRPPTGMAGLARALMAFTVLSTLCVALFALMLANSGDAADLRQTLLASLTSVLATIVGFYFGTRAATPTGQEAEPERVR